MNKLLEKQVTYWKNCFEEVGFKYKKQEQQLKEAEKVIDKVIAIQQTHYGNATSTHMALDDWAKQVKKYKTSQKGSVL